MKQENPYRASHKEGVKLLLLMVKKEFTKKNLLGNKKLKKNVETSSTSDTASEYDYANFNVSKTSENITYNLERFIWNYKTKGYKGRIFAHRSYFRKTRNGKILCPSN